MKTRLILGGGTASTILANKMVTRLPSDWKVEVVDQNDHHHYQPGFLFVPVGMMPAKRVTKFRRAQFKDGVNYTETEILSVDPDKKVVATAAGDKPYDVLVVATGTQIHPEMVEGRNDDRIWRASAHEFYTLEGSERLRDALNDFKGGKVLVHVAEMPIKCSVAPLEITLLMEDYFRKRHVRHKVDITYVIPLDGAFTKPMASKELCDLIEARSVRLAHDFAVEKVDPEAKTLNSYDGRALPFDLFVEVPPHMGAGFLAGSGLADDQNFVTVDKHTLQHTKYQDVFTVGDAANVPTSKAGAVAHFEIDKLVENIEQAIKGQAPTRQFDGHANCFVESGRGKAMLLDFNYDTQALTGKFPVPLIGPMTLLGEFRLNHMDKLGFELIYWNALLPGVKIPIPADMNMAGKYQPK